MKLVDYEKYYHLGSEFIIPRDEFEKIIEENQKLKKEVAKLHIIQEEYGNHIENTHIIDDYQKTYFMSNKYLIELKNGKFVYIDEIEKENQRLNNVLNELEKWVYQFREEHKNDTGIFDKFLTTREILDKLKELKESDK